MKSTFVITVVLAATAAFFQNATSISPEKEAELKELGFIGGGPYSSPFGERSGKSMSLWLSSDLQTQKNALEICDRIGGKLVSILTKQQDEDVKMTLYRSDIDNEYWTSAIWDTPLQTWYWLPIGVPATFYNNFNKSCNAIPGFGVTVRFAVSEYRWCSSSVLNSRRYICQL